MIFGIRFLVFRLIIFTIAALAQGYLFLRVRNAIRSCGLSDRFKVPAIFLVGAVLLTLFLVNAYIMVTRLS